MKRNKTYMMIFAMVLIFLLVLITQTKKTSAHWIVPGIGAVSVDVNGGYPQGSNITLGLNNVFCVQQGQRVRSGWVYSITHYWTIDGRVSKAYEGNRGRELATHENDENAMLAWLLAQGDSGSNLVTHEYSKKQRELYTLFPQWQDANVMHFASNTGNGYGTSDWQGEARAYAERVKNTKPASITNNRDNSSLVKEMYQAEDGTEYIKVGAFNWTFEGSFINWEVYDQNNQLRTVKFAKYVGTTLSISDSMANFVTSGQDFYLLIPVDSGITRINKFTAKVQSDRDNVTVEMWILLKTDNSAAQSIITTEATIGRSTSDASISIENIDLTGSVKIIKVDPDKENNNKLSNVGFKVQNKETQKYIKQENDTIQYVDNVEEATEFVTDSNGEILIENILIGDYIVYETKNPNHGYEVNPEGIEITVGVDSVMEYEISNTKEYIGLSGTIWEDIAWEVGKGTQSNELYKYGELDVNDKELQGISVKLIHVNNGIVNETKTQEDGTYKFENVLIDELNNYYIEFTYNGMSYKNVTAKTEHEKGSKAEEGNSRKQFNENYAIITNGQSNNLKGNKVYDISYDRENYKSTLNYGENSKDSSAYGYSGQKYPVTNVDEQYLISSTTYNTYNGCLNKIVSIEEIRKNGLEEITNINLGLQEREQPDLAIVKDIQSAKVTINDKQHIYEYNDRFKNVASEDELYNMDVSIKFGNNSRNMPYTRALYESDIRYTNPDKTKELEVRVTYKIGMKNTSTNLLATINTIDDYYDNKYELVAVGTKINDDGSVVTGDGSELEYNTPQAYNNEYQKVVITTNTTVSSQEQQFIYMEFKVADDALMEILDDGTDNEVKLDNIVEISSYSVYDQNNELYAGIDIDAEPGNVDVTAPTTFEDDTDVAKGLKLVLQEKRSTSGTVFEDKAILPDGVAEDEVNTGEIRHGSGAYEEGTDKTIEGVNVTLIDEEGNTIQVYDEEQEKWVDGTAVTDENGEYEISGFVPGDYQIKYTWGGQTDGEETTYTVQDYKSTVVDKTVWNDKQTEENQDTWYKDTFKQGYTDKEWNTQIDEEIRTSDAVDNYVTREKIDDQIKEINHEVIDNIEEAYNQPEDSTNPTEIITQMDSYTPKFTINIEYDTDKTQSSEEYETDEKGNVIMNGDYAVKKEEYKNELTSIDFGIVERARQEISVDKLIRKLTLTLADGRILANIEIDENGNATTKTQGVGYVGPTQSDPGLVRVEIDNEYLQGTTVVATYEIRVTNTSEKDYVDEEYYLYGIEPNTQNEVVKLTPTKVIDYVDPSWVLSSDTSSEWTTKQLNEVKNEKLVTEEAEDAIADSSVRVLYTNTLSNKELLPENKTSIYTTFSKLLTTTDEISFNNEVEIIYVSKTGGAPLYEEIPGNYEPGLGSQEEDDAQASQAVIVPATGANLNYIPLVTLIISSCMILVTGTMLIKKLVLGQKK